MDIRCTFFYSNRQKVIKYSYNIWPQNGLLQLCSKFLSFHSAKFLRVKYTNSIPIIFTKQKKAKKVRFFFLFFSFEFGCKILNGFSKKLGKTWFLHLKEHSLYHKRNLSLINNKCNTFYEVNLSCKVKLLKPEDGFISQHLQG